MNKRAPSGFTIVELLIVVVVIAILAAVTVVSYNGITQRAQESGLKSDLVNRAKKLSIDDTAAGGFSVPIITPYLNIDATNTTTAYKYGDLKSFCVEGVSKQNSNLRYNVQLSNGGITTLQGPCPTLTTTEVVSRCVAGNVVLVVDQTNYSSETITSVISGAYGTDTSTPAAGAHHSIAFSTRIASMPRGAVSIALTGSSFATTRFHAYDPRSC